MLNFEFIFSLLLFVNERHFFYPSFIYSEPCLTDLNFHTQLIFLSLKAYLVICEESVKTYSFEDSLLRVCIAEDSTSISSVCINAYS